MKKTIINLVLFALAGCATQSADSFNKSESESQQIKKIVCKNEVGMTRCSKVDTDKLWWPQPVPYSTLAQ